MSTSPRDLEAAIAATRFGLGARPGEIGEAARDPRSYLKAQIRRQGADVFDTGGETGRQRAEGDPREPTGDRSLVAVP